MGNMTNRMVQGLDFLRLAGRLFTHKNHGLLYFKKGLLIAMGTLSWSGICHVMEGINSFNL